MARNFFLGFHIHCDHKGCGRRARFEVPDAQDTLTAGARADADEKARSAGWKIERHLGVTWTHCPDHQLAKP